MNFVQMEYIVQVASEMSITKAAEKLFISPSGLSQSITQLENELELKIFNRSKQGVSPTFEGQLVISKAITMLNTMNELKKEIYVYKKSNPTNLKILTAPTFTYLLQETMVKFHTENNDVTFDLIEQNPTDIIQNFYKDNYDFAILPSSIEVLKKEKNIRYEHIHEGYICIAVGKNSPFYSNDYVTPKDLLNGKFVMYQELDYRPLLRITKLNKHQLVFKSNKSSILLELVKESQAFLYLHNFTINNLPMVLNGDIKVIPLKDENYFYMDFWLIYLETKSLTETAQKFIKEFLGHLKSSSNIY